MAGIFAQWQPAYAEAGIATFPVDGDEKRPLVRNYLIGGHSASQQWARKFGHKDAFGFACGKRSGVTVADVDESDEKLLSDVIDRFGPSPVIIRTPSRKFHVYYRSNGERRAIRIAGFDGPVDLLGGGLVLAPPSRGSKGSYEWVQGSLADLQNLPRIREGADGPTLSEVVASASSIEKGKRNDALFRACLVAAASFSGATELINYAHSLSRSGTWAALPASEVERTATSAWKYQAEGRNWLAGDRTLTLTAEELSILEASPDGQYIFVLLRRNHWNRDFVLANGWHKKLPCRSWSLERFRAARKFLTTSGLIVQVRPAKKGVGPALFRFSTHIPGRAGRRV